MKGVMRGSPFFSQSEPIWALPQGCTHKKKVVRNSRYSAPDFLKDFQICEIDLEIDSVNDGYQLYPRLSMQLLRYRFVCLTYGKGSDVTLTLCLWVKGGVGGDACVRGWEGGFGSCFL